MITNIKMNKNLWDRLARGEKISQERLDDCLGRVHNEGRDAKYTGPERFRRLILLKKPDKSILYPTAPYSDADELIPKLDATALEKPKKD